MEPTSRPTTRPWWRSLADSLRSVPVFVKVMGIALGMAVILGSGLLWQIHRTWHRQMIRDLEDQGRTFATQVAVHCRQLTQAGRTADIPAELQHSLAEATDAAFIILRNADGSVLARASMAGAADDSPRIRRVSVPLGDPAHRVEVGLSTGRVDREVGWLTRRLALTTALIALVGMAGAWWVSRVFAHPIEELATLTRALKAGDYQSRAVVRARDEVGELAAAFNEMAEAIGRKESMRTQLLRQVIRAGEDERRRIARELHDQTGQALTSQIAALSAIESRCSDPALRGRLGELRLQAEQTLADVHDLSVTLRPAALEDLGLLPALERHCQLFAQRCGVQITCTGTGLREHRLPAEIELTVYRLVQEMLTNAVRHGRASRVQAVVQRTSSGVLVSVEDNGSGFDAADWPRRCLEGGHLGLPGMQERVALLGGSLTVESAPGAGTTVSARIPLREET